ncbi:MAG: hypothetical protein ACMUIM_03560 [bacterium]
MKKDHLFLLFIILFIFFGCANRKSVITEDGLEGVWKTKEPRYSDCSLALTKDLIIFASGHIFEVLDAFLLKSIDVNYILKVKKTSKKRKEELDLYTIYYESMEKQKFKFSFYFDPSDGGKIIFKNQKQIEWQKEGELKIKIPKDDQWKMIHDASILSYENVWENLRCL